jgi:hypothetical protein
MVTKASSFPSVAGLNVAVAVFRFVSAEEMKTRLIVYTITMIAVGFPPDMFETRLNLIRRERRI